MAFTAPITLQTVPEDIPKVYLSGYSEQEELEIKAKKKQLEERDLILYPVTIDEFRTIISPWFRINRTEEFNLHPVKVKTVRVPKEPKAKVVKEPKVKKLTKAQVQAKMMVLIVKMATGESFTEEETLFYKEQTGG